MASERGSKIPGRRLHRHHDGTSIGMQLDTIFVSTSGHHGTKRQRMQSRRLPSCRMWLMLKLRMLTSMRRVYKKNYAQIHEG
jgi:hypothetical protein